jgi:formylglycine-generating enzyme required for sulfatase activity
MQDEFHVAILSGLTRDGGDRLVSIRGARAVMFVSSVETLRQALVVDPADHMAWLALADSLEEDGAADCADLIHLREWLREAPENDDRRRKECRLHELLRQGVRPVMPRLRVVLAAEASLEMVLIPPGRFLMGSPEDEPGRMSDEGPRHRVTLTEGFWLGIYPVTQIQWRAVMGDNPSRFVGGQRPVEQVTRADALAFCAELTQRAGLPFRLPTEAEWEYACRAGTTSAYHFGNTASADLASFNGQHGEETTPVGQFPPNAWGLFDMHGNVWEWCGDRKRWYASEDVVDPAQQDAGVPVARGGAWVSEPGLCRSASRWSDPGRRHSFLGFRLAMTLERGWRV